MYRRGLLLRDTSGKRAILGGEMSYRTAEVLEGT